MFNFFIGGERVSMGILRIVWCKRNGCADISVCELSAVWAEWLWRCAVL